MSVFFMLKHCKKQEKGMTTKPLTNKATVLMDDDQ